MASGWENLDIDPVFTGFSQKVIQFWDQWEMISFFFFSKLFPGSTGSFFLLNSQASLCRGK